MRLGGLVILASIVLVGTAHVGATPNTIQPGDSMSSSIGGCTLNFVFDGTGALAGRVFIGTAAHCVDHVGETVNSAPYTAFGTVAAIGNAGSAVTDWAIIEVREDLHRFVKAAVKGHPDMPTGVATPDQTNTGDLVQISGYGMLFGTSAPTQERRVAVLVEQDNDHHTITGPVVFGDSGGPLTHIATGGALGLNSRIPVGCPCTEYGPTIQGLLAQAAAKGFTLELRTV